MFDWFKRLAALSALALVAAVTLAVIALGLCPTRESLPEPTLRVVDGIQPDSAPA